MRTQILCHCSAIPNFHPQEKTVNEVATATATSGVYARQRRAPSVTQTSSNSHVTGSCLWPQIVPDRMAKNARARSTLSGISIMLSPAASLEAACASARPQVLDQLPLALQSSANFIIDCVPNSVIGIAIVKLAELHHASS